MIIQEEEKKKPICEFCGKRIVGSKWNKEYNHVNICQDPAKRMFCSHHCKIRWIFEQD